MQIQNNKKSLFVHLIFVNSVVKITPNIKEIFQKYVICRYYQPTLQFGISLLIMH